MVSFKIIENNRPFKLAMADLGNWVSSPHYIIVSIGTLVSLSKGGGSYTLLKVLILIRLQICMI